jgi:uncharacterized protein YjbI with pentapeptide repeats
VLYYADLTGADLSDAEFDTANVYQTTAPDGTVVDTVATLKNHLLDD